jgi:competence protein ComEA
VRRRLVVVTGLVLLAGPARAQTGRPPSTAPIAPSAPAGIDLNSASRDELMTLDGIGEVKADAIIRGRPFKAKTELVERRIVPEALYDKINARLIVRPIPGTPAAPAATPTPRR